MRSVELATRAKNMEKALRAKYVEGIGASESFSRWNVIRKSGSKSQVPR